MGIEATPTEPQAWLLQHLGSEARDRKATRPGLTDSCPQKVGALSALPYLSGHSSPPTAGQRKQTKRETGTLAHHAPGVASSLRVRPKKLTT